MTMTPTLNTSAAMPDQILIIGGGFAGFWAAVAARRVAGPRAAVTLVSPAPMLEIRPRLYEARPETLAVDLLPLLRKVDVSFVRGEAMRLDTTAKAVTLAAGDRLAYDRLVVATGSRMRRPPVPGAEAAFSVDTQAEAIAFDLRLSEIARDVAEPTIAVVGAGFTGIELALELRDRLKVHGATVRALAAEGVSFADGSSLAADAVVLASGMAASPFAAQVAPDVPGVRDELGRVVVDAALRAPAAPEVFVAGDAAAADTGDGHRTLQSCQHAGQLGRVAGENAARDLLGLPPVPYTQLRYVTCLDLGRSGAVIAQGWERRIEKTGNEGKAVKRLINTQVIYPPADGTAEALLACSSTNLADRAGRVDGTKAGKAA
jgi:NADH:ubiquinone reductase (H+-translocating)